MIVPSPKLRKSLERAAQSYHKQLANDDEALNYLVRGRGISRSALDFFQLGVVRDPEPGHEQFRDRISFPYHTPTGITSIRFRRLSDNPDTKAPKFLSIVGDVTRLYNVSALIDTTKIYICEGETDTIACWQAGLPAVGVPGAMNWQAPFSRVFRNRDVVVLADNDDNGEGKKFADHIFRSVDGCDIVLMPQGYDVSLFTQEYGVDALRKKVGL